MTHWPFLQITCLLWHELQNGEVRSPTIESAADFLQFVAFFSICSVGLHTDWDWNGTLTWAIHESYCRIETQVRSIGEVPVMHLQNKKIKSEFLNEKNQTQRDCSWETERTTAGCGLSPVVQLHQAGRELFFSVTVVSKFYSRHKYASFHFEVENVLLVLTSSSSAGQVPAPRLVTHLDELSTMKQPLAWG